MSAVSRRSFLKQATLSVATLKAATLGGRNVLVNLIHLEDLAPIQNELLRLVNDERAEGGLTSLKLDDLASSVAQKHAVEMAEYDFLSHWGRDGLKPYHRYSFAGGTDAMAENDAAADYSRGTIESDEMPFAVVRMHKTMYGEVPPNDGHRQTILTPQHTHVGFGMAWRGVHIRLSELYVSRYVSIDPYSPVKRPLSRFIFGGVVLDPKFSIVGIEVYYEALPSPPSLSWLQTPRPYGLPENPVSLYPKLPGTKTYDNGTPGEIQLLGRGRFRAPVELSRKAPGIYTLVVWISRSENEPPFPATQVCIRAE